MFRFVFGHTLTLSARGEVVVAKIYRRGTSKSGVKKGVRVREEKEVGCRDGKWTRERKGCG